jgi:hypothetical protein
MGFDAMRSLLGCHQHSPVGRLRRRKWRQGRSLGFSSELDHELDVRATGIAQGAVACRHGPLEATWAPSPPIRRPSHPSLKRAAGNWVIMEPCSAHGLARITPANDLGGIPRSLQRREYSSNRALTPESRLAGGPQFRKHSGLVIPEIHCALPQMSTAPRI